MNFAHVTDEVVLPTGITAKVREFIGSDEDILSNPSYNKQNKTFEYLLKAIVLELDGTAPTMEALSNMYSADRTALLIASRTLSFGDEVKGNLKCDNQSCGVEFEVSMSLEDLPYTAAPEELEQTVKLPSGMVVTFRPLRGKDEARFIKARKEGDILTTMILTRLVRVETPEGEELSSANWRTWLQKGSIRDRNALRDKFDESHFGYKTEIKADCPHCGDSYETEVIGLMGFFFPSM